MYFNNFMKKQAAICPARPAFSSPNSSTMSLPIPVPADQSQQISSTSNAFADPDESSTSSTIAPCCSHIPRNDHNYTMCFQNNHNYHPFQSQTLPSTPPNQTYSQVGGNHSHLSSPPLSVPLHQNNMPSMPAYTNSNFDQVSSTDRGTRTGGMVQEESPCNQATKVVQAFEQQQVEVDDSVVLVRCIARLSSLLMQQTRDGTENRHEMMAKLLSCNVLHNLYTFMFRYPQNTELQHDIKEALNAIQNYPSQGSQHQQQQAPVQQIPCSHSEAPPSSTQTATPSETRTMRANNPYIKHRTDLNLYECTECGKQYMHLCNLRSHSKIHTDKAYCCEFCGKKFGRKSNWMEHTRVHTGERPFQCNVCSKSFKHKHQLKEHTKKHSDTS